MGTGRIDGARGKREPHFGTTPIAKTDLILHDSPPRGRFRPLLCSAPMQELTQRLADALSRVEDGCLLVVTGAGISRASGIPTFRGTDPQAVWKSSDIALATFEHFVRDPVGQWLWYLKRFEAGGTASPNPAHAALVRLEAWQRRRGGKFLLVTQNIDTLHEAAGSREVVKVHGSSDRVRCSRAGCRLGSPTGSLAFTGELFEPFRRRPDRSTLPLCPECGALLRAHVLFFDEYYLEHHDYRFGEAEAAAGAADLMLFVGTSFSVGITDLFLRAGRQRRIPMFSIDPAAAGQFAASGLTALPAAAEELLPAVCTRLEAAVDDRPARQT